MLCNSLKNQLLTELVGKTESIPNVYIGLSTTAPLENGTGVVEPQGNGYARILIGHYDQALTQKFGNPENGEITNKEIIYFPESTGAWGTLTHFVLFRSASGTNASDVLAGEAFTSPITVSAANTVVMFREGELTIRIEDN